MNGKQIIVDMDPSNKNRNPYMKSSSPFKTGNQLGTKSSKIQLSQEDNSMDAYASEYKPPKRDTPGFVSYQK